MGVRFIKNCYKSPKSASMKVQVYRVLYAPGTPKSPSEKGSRMLLIQWQVERDGLVFGAEKLRCDTIG